MINIYNPKHFRIEELVPPIVYNTYKDNSIWFLNIQMLITLDLIRDYFKLPITVNNWHLHGKFRYRGFREPSCKVGASLSQHKFGRAFDFDIEGIKPEEFRHILKKKPNHKAFKAITCCEKFVDWIHIDNRQWNKDKHGILFITP